MPTASPIAICSRNTRTTIQKLASACVASSISPTISAIPTGSLAPDSPSRIVRLRPSISRAPSTENITAGSVGATAAPSRPAVSQPRPNDRVHEQRDQAAQRERAEHAERGDRAHGDAEPPHADRRSALEEDDDQRDGRDPLDGRDLHDERGEDVGRDRRRDEKERRRGDREAVAQLGDVQRGDERSREDEHPQPEGRELVHAPPTLRRGDEGRAGIPTDRVHRKLLTSPSRAA